MRVTVTVTLVPENINEQAHMREMDTPTPMTHLGDGVYQFEVSSNGFTIPSLALAVALGDVDRAFNRRDANDHQ